MKTLVLVDSDLQANTNIDKIQTAVDIIKDGGVIAYPTEAVYGLGCSPLDQIAVMKILKLKARSVEKGLILISDDFETLQPYLNLNILTSVQINTALNTWPGPYTWVFPVSSLTPAWIKGNFDSVAVRVTKHPIAAQLCHDFGGPIVSTSANVSSELPARNLEQVLAQFPEGLDAIVVGELGSQSSPSEIRDVQTGAVLR